MSSRDEDARDEDVIGRLIGKAGRGPTASAEAKARVYAAVHSTWRESVEATAGRDSGSSAIRHARARRLWPVGLAASLGAIAIIAYWLQTQPPGPRAEVGRTARVEGVVELSRDSARSTLTASGTAIEAGDVVTTGPDGRAAFDLINGIVLRVAAGSESVFVSPQRLELRAGTVYLDAGERAGVPAFGIGTRFGTIEHVGTQYEVHVDAAAVRIRIREGSVAFRDGPREIIGDSGEQLLIGASGAPTRSAFASYDPAWRWTTELAVLGASSEYRLADLLRWIARETGRELEYEQPTLERRAATLDLHGLEGLGPEEVLEVLRRTTDLSYRASDGRLLVH